MRIKTTFACCVVMFTFVHGCNKSQNLMETDSLSTGSEWGTETMPTDAVDEGTDSDAASDSFLPDEMTTDSLADDGDTESHAADSSSTVPSETDTTSDEGTDTDTLAGTDEPGRLYPGPCSESEQFFSSIIGLETHRVVWNTWDERGNLIESEAVNVMFNSVIRRTTYTYDENDRLTRTNIDSDADSIIDLFIKNSYAADGALLTEDRYEDKDGTGTWQYHKRTTYDAMGNVVLTELDEVDWQSEEAEIDDVWDRIIHYTYDKDGHLLKEEWDYNTDGVVDALTIKTYDDHGNLLRDEDYNMDGEITRASEHQYTYDDEGHMLIERYDNAGDGFFEKVFTRTFDDQSRILSRTEITEESGDIYSIQTYTYDEAGNLVLEDKDIHGDGIIDSRVQHEYNDAGLLVRIATYRGADELSNEVIYTYDAYGNPVERTLTSDKDGYSIETYNYDCWK